MKSYRIINTGIAESHDAKFSTLTLFVIKTFLRLMKCCCTFSIIIKCDRYMVPVKDIFCVYIQC